MKFFRMLFSTIPFSAPFMDLDDGGNVGGGGVDEFLGLHNEPLKSLSDVHPFDDDSTPATDNNQESQSGFTDGNNESDVQKSEDGQAHNNGTELATQSDNLILGKFKDTESLSTAYLNLQSFSTKTAQEKAHLAEEVAKLSQELDNLRKQQQSVPPATNNQSNTNTNTYPDPDELAKMTDEELDLMLNKPLEYKQKLINELRTSLLNEVKEQLAPDLKVAQEIRMTKEEQLAWEEAASKAAKAFNPETGEQLYPDLFELKDEVAKAFEMLPQLAKDKDFGGAVQVARLLKAQSTQSAPKPEELLNDDEFVQKNVLTNQKIRESILKAHLESIQKGNPPPQLNSNSGGSPSATPVEKPKTLREASRRIMSRLASGLTK